MARLTTISKRYLKPRWNFLSQDSHGTLSIEGWDIEDIVEKYGTPVYLIVERKIREQLRAFKKAFPYPKLRVQYASKVNSNLEILKIVREEGMELDCSSVGEIILGMLADFEPHQITFTNLHKTEQDITFAAKVGVQAITADSMEEIRKIDRVASKLKTKIRIFIRINPMLKIGQYTTHNQHYGIVHSEAKKAIDLAIASRYVDLVGLHFHGSYIYNPQVYFQAATKLVKLAKYCIDHKARIRYIDLGGGFPYATNGKKVFHPSDMGEAFVKHFQKLIKKYDIPSPSLIFEPGKFVVANAGVGVVRVISSKRFGNTNKVITDGSTYAFLPDPLIYKAYYEVLPATKMDKPRWDYITLAGCTCDSADIIAHKRWLPKLEEGDILAFMDVGAYSNVMASNFNTIKRAPIIMLKGDGSIKPIRRKDRYSEMFAPELDVLKVGEPQELKKFYNLFRVNIDKLWQPANDKKNQNNRK